MKHEYYKLLCSFELNRTLLLLIYRRQILDEKMLPIQKVYSHYWSLITLYTTRVHPSSQRRRRILASHLLKLKELTNIFD